MIIILLTLNYQNQWNIDKKIFPLHQNFIVRKAICTDCTSICKANYHSITTTAPPAIYVIWNWDICDSTCMYVHSKLRYLHFYYLSLYQCTKSPEVYPMQSNQCFKTEKWTSGAGTAYPSGKLEFTPCF
jgi:hypothetical protein